LLIIEQGGGRPARGSTAVDRDEERSDATSSGRPVGQTDERSSGRTGADDRATEGGTGEGKDGEGIVCAGDGNDQERQGPGVMDVIMGMHHQPQ